MMNKTKDELVAEIRLFCKQLKLSQSFVDRAVDHATDHSILELLHVVLEKEVEQRKASRIGKEISRACFPCHYERGDFDDSNVLFPEGVTLQSLMGLSFCNASSLGNIIMYGGPGSGKTMLSIILGQEACRSNLPTLFYNTQVLLDNLRAEYEKGQLPTYLERLSKVRVLILDEFVYVPYDILETRLLYRLLSRLAGRTAVILNTNVEFSKWTESLPDERLAASIAGKVMANGILLIFRGGDRRFEAVRVGR